MSHATYEFHSPLTLLREWDRRPDGVPLREFLVTGYTLDLVFFERHCVSTARALGGRITVLGDAEHAVHEPVDVRQAGRVYQHGRASCGGAFHPKLVVLAGDDDVWVAVGSGNPTMSGWGHNHELWLVLRASRHHGPAALRDLGDWLVDLPQVVRMPSWIAETVTEVGRWITPADLDGTLPSLRIFGNLRQSLLGQLPSEPVRSLRMTAPFFDARAQAVRALIAHLRPAEVDIAVQENLSQFNGQALSDATGSVPRVGFWFLDEERTRHGKLVEWTVDGETIALTGSANLSAAAMLATTATGGNCELVTCWPVPASLLPQDTPVDRAVISEKDTIPAESASSDSPALVMLGARRVRNTVVVELLASTPEPITVESSPDGTPGTWMPVHIVSPDGNHLVTATFTAPEVLGGAIRAFVNTAGGQIISQVVFLTDTIRCRAREDTADRPRMGPFTELDEVFTDPILARRFNTDLLRLLSHVQEHKAATATTAPLRSHAITAQATASDDRWGAWLHDVERSLGPSLTGLIFPGALILPEGETAGWSVGPDADDSELTDGETEDAIEDLPDVAQRTAVRIAPDIPPSQRQQYRAWARRWTRTVSTPPHAPLHLRMLVARTYLDLLAAAVWGTDEDWRTELRDLVRSLVPTPDEEASTPGQAMDFLSSLIAVCLALLLQDATLHGGSEHDIVAKAAWDDAADWAAYADPQLAEEYLYVPDKPYARVPGWSEVNKVIDLAVSVADDAHAELRTALEQESLPAELINGVWVIDGEFRNPRRIAARVATLANSPCAVLARNPRKTSMILLEGRTLVIAESTAPLWRIYKMTPLGTPLSTLGGDDGLPGNGTIHPLEPIPPVIRQLAENAHANLTLLLAALRTANSPAPPPRQG